MEFEHGFLISELDPDIIPIRLTSLQSDWENCLKLRLK
jgi:hypothetical protein